MSYEFEIHVGILPVFFMMERITVFPMKCFTVDSFQYQIKTLDIYFGSSIKWKSTRVFFLPKIS